MVLADVCRRWAELKGQEAIICTGTDEHGLKVQRSAEAADLPTQEFCDMNSQTFRDVAKRFIGDNHDFIRTTDLKHVNAVQEFWRKLNERELIYESMHKGWYSVKDECFYPDDMLTWSVDPVFGKPKLVTKVDNSPVEWVEEKNYHFRLTAFRDRLLKWYDNNPEWIKPRSQMMEVRRWVEDRLEDLSISRPAKRLHWGVPVPDDPSQTIYVWVDALINYISNSNFPYWHRDKQSRKGWPADLQIIGKDIVRFHGVYWPALLMALGLPLPKQILSHGHWTLGGGKMSKSSGNGVDPAAAVERFGVEGVRWFLMRRGPFEGDSAWDNLDVAQEYRSSLADTYGNLMNRLLRSQKWNLRPAVRWGEDLKPPPELGQDTMLLDFEKAMDEHRPDRAIERVLSGLRWVSCCIFYTHLHGYDL
jgi:methionyl-tRNA synthetase